ncbi:cytochrome P450 [Cynara cardunculus var. scolymus]|uniref:Cytochrome P450 n=1 Tax=Cynara cardunculus var. scolymus TaxID=59895 RepID=A0A103XSY5_CYNCS|nr:cytochrome P450 [Cynara cardunculus var. scolymus]
MLSLLFLLAGFLFWWQYSTHIHGSKLPPGPMPLPIIGNLHLLGKQPSHRALYKLSQRYGSIMSMRLGSVNAVVISSPEAAKLFLGTHDAVFASRPKLQASKYLYHGKGMVLTEYGPHWQNVRKFCLIELLSAVKVNRFAGMRREEIGLMVGKIRAASKAHEVVDLGEVAGGLIEGMTCRMLFGKKNDERFGLTRKLKSLSEEIDEMLESLITEKEECSVATLQRCDQTNFIDTLLSLKNEYSNTHDNLSASIDRLTMKAVLLDMLAGGIDTSKTAIEWILSELIKHPRVMKELQQEIKTVVGDKHMVEEIDLAKLSYLHMVIKEGLRLYPIAPLLVPHESIEDVVINGYEIPKKTLVLVNAWAIGRDPKVWSENSSEFFPERFGDREIDFRGPEFQLMAFNTGRRGCPGMNLGLINIGLAVSNLVHCFDWILPNGMSPNDLDMNEKSGLNMPKIEPLLAIPTYRMGA